MHRLGTSVQLYGLRGEVDRNPRGTIERLADIGFGNVESSFDTLTRSAQLRRALSDRRLGMPTMMASLLRPDRREAFRLASDLGVETVVDADVGADQWTSARGVEELAAMFRVAAAEASQFGVTVAYHNHHAELRLHDGVRPSLYYFADLVGDEVLFEIDAYWVMVGGVRPDDAIHALGDRVRFLHLSDGPGLPSPDHLPLGQGCLPLSDILESAVACELYVIEFDDYSGDIFEGVSTSLRVLTDSLT